MDSRPILLGLVGIILVGWIAIVVIRNRRFDRMQRLLMEQRFDELYALLDKSSTQALYPEYNLAYFRLNAYIMQGDDEKATAALDEMLARNLTDEQRRDLTVKAFNYFVGREDKKRSKKLLGEIEGWDDQYQGVKHESRMTYDITIAKLPSYIDELEERVQNSKGLTRGRLEYLLGTSYANAGDKQRSEQHLAASRAIMDGNEPADA